VLHLSQAYAFAPLISLGKPLLIILFLERDLHFGHAFIIRYSINSQWLRAFKATEKLQNKNPYIYPF